MTSAPGSSRSELRPAGGALLHDGSAALPARLRGTVMMLGNFDGLHLGHRAVLERARAIAGGRPLAVMCCDPHPRTFFAPGSPPFRIGSAAVRRFQFERAGISLIYAPRFDAAFAVLSPEAFAAEVLGADLGVSAVVAGADFRFGAGRSGDMALLAELGRSIGFEVISITDIAVGGARVSSSAIREHILRGDIGAAAARLGAPWMTQVRRLRGTTGIAFDAGQILPPAGRYRTLACDAQGRPLGHVDLMLGSTRIAEGVLPPATAFLLWE